MNVAPAIFEILRNDETISGIVKSRIYPDQVPQNVPYPALVHYKTDVEKSTVKSADTENYKVRWQIDVYTAKYGEAATLSQAIIDLLDEYRGTVKNINIQGVYFQSQSDDTFIQELEAFATQMSFLFRIVKQN